MLLMLKQLLAILDSKDRKNLFFVFILVMIMAIIESLGVVSILPFLAVLANPENIENNLLLKRMYNFIGASNFRDFIVLSGCISLVFVTVSSLFKILTQYSLNHYSATQRHKLSTRLLNIYFHQKYVFFVKNNSSSLVKNVLSETDQLIWGVIQPALLMMSYGIVLFFMIILLLAYDFLVAVIVACIILFFYIILYALIKTKLNEISSSFTYANKQRYQSCQESLGGMKDVIINQAQNGYMNVFSHYSKVFSRNLAIKDTLGQIPRNILETVGYGCLIGLAIFWVLSKKDISNILPQLGLYGFAAYKMLPAAQNIYYAVTQIKFSEHIFIRLREDFLLGVLDADRESDKLNTINFTKFLKLEEICFSYSARGGAVFNKFNLIVKKNESVGIIGKSGSGKSTLMDIMLGLLEPQSGKVIVDDSELNYKKLSEWHNILGYVPQNIYLADKSIAENIAFGITKDKINMEQVENVARQAQLHDFINTQLPQGYETMVGERGVLLSGGQKQRVGIARALYKKPEILFMDEATSALDVETEKAVNDAIHKLSGKITMVIIAHRESAVSTCNKIIKLG